MKDEHETIVPLTCRRCEGAMSEGVALRQTLTGLPDFPGGAVATVSPGGPGRLVPCMKCVTCGYSLSIGGRRD